METAAANNIILVGMTGAGKSRCGFLLARYMHLGFIDLDDYIEKKEGKKITEIFKSKGEDFFRNLESKYLQFFQGIENHVISLGGGTFENEENRKVARSMGTIVYIDVPQKVLTSRLLKKKEELLARPLFSDLDHKDPELEKKIELRLETIYRQRRGNYEKADVTVFDAYSTVEYTARLMRDALKNQSKS